MGVTVSAESEAMLERLLAADIVGPTDNDEQVEVTDAFSDSIDKWQSVVEECGQSELRAELRPVIGDETEVAAMLDATDVDDRIIAEYLAVSHTDAADFEHAERLRVLIVLDFVSQSLPDSGVPDTFVPVDGERLPFFLRAYRKAVVYIWLNDCEECEEMKSVLEQSSLDQYEETARFAVYGPDCAELLHSEYDVPGGPATLFTLDGTVDARLYGVHTRDVVESEIETLAELA